MGKLSVFTVRLDRPIYWAGDEVTGSVHVELMGDMAMQAIILELEGSAHVKWSERDGSGKKKRTRHYHAEENYFNQEFLLFGSKDEHNKSTLAAGQHTFNFRYQLPVAVPSSFEAVAGHVRYVARARIAKPWKFNHNTRTHFTVISILDLNTQPSATLHRQGRNSYNLCCLCCKSGPIEASFHIQRRGYVPGEAVKLYADISNGAGRVMDGSFVELKMVTTFRSAAKSKTEVTTVAKVKRPAIPGHGQDQWTGEALVIPALPPSFLVGCGIIEIRYILELNVDPSGWGVNLEIPLEILIGSIPLTSVTREPVSETEVVLKEKALESSVKRERRTGVFDEPNPEDFKDVPLPRNFPSKRQRLPRPSFSESVTGRVSVQEQHDDEFVRGAREFAPVYTVYEWGDGGSVSPTM